MRAALAMVVFYSGDRRSRRRCEFGRKPSVLTSDRHLVDRHLDANRSVRLGLGDRWRRAIVCHWWGQSSSPDRLSQHGGGLRRNVGHTGVPKFVTSCSKIHSRKLLLGVHLRQWWLRHCDSQYRRGLLPIADHHSYTVVCQLRATNSEVPRCTATSTRLGGSCRRHILCRRDLSRSTPLL